MHNHRIGEVLTNIKVLLERIATVVEMAYKMKLDPTQHLKSTIKFYGNGEMIWCRMSVFFIAGEQKIEKIQMDV